MLYIDYMTKVKEIAIIENEETGMVYIRPDYEYALETSGIKLSEVTDFENVTRDNVYRQLLLERDMLNVRNDKMPYVAQWLYDVIYSMVDPAIVEEQDKLMKDMIEYRKEKNAIDNRTKELNQKQQELEEKNKILPFNFGMDFRKKKP